MLPPDADDSKTVRHLGTYEMLWDCKFCGAQGLPAHTHRFCPTCGSAQDPKTRRFPSDEEKKAVVDHVNKGADLICPACGTTNSGDAKFCHQCGAPLENAETASRLQDQVRGASQSFQAGEQRDVAAESMAQDLKTAEPASSGFPRGVIIGLVIAAIACVGIIFLLTRTQSGTAVVTGHTWEREIMIESLEPHNESAWCDSMPSDAYSISRRTEQRDTRRIQDGETCSVRRIDNGDGTFSEREECVPRYREEPVYDDRCYFTVDRWGYSRSVISTGDSQSEMPYWANAQLQFASGIGAEREAGRDENYVLILHGDGDAVYECQVDYDLWQSASVESTWNLEISVVGGQPLCDTLAAAG